MDNDRPVIEPKNRKIGDKISSYTEYLKKEYGLAISIHFADKYNYVFYCEKNLLVYNVHINPYCFKMKSNRKNRQKCLRCQKLVLHHCGECESFVGRCYAGVSEYICGIYSDGEPVGFISVSGYRDKNIPFGQNNLYDESMKDEEIPVQLLDTLISPLGLMLERLVSETPLIDIGDDVYFRILNYLNEHHADVSVAELAERFCFSRSYISHMFKKRSGCTLNTYCNMLKIKDAKALLKESNISVTEVAYSVGFNNFSYFITTFKSLTGMTPLVWRKKNQLKS